MREKFIGRGERTRHEKEGKEAAQQNGGNKEEMEEEKKEASKWMGGKGRKMIV